MYFFFLLVLMVSRLCCLEGYWNNVPDHVLVYYSRLGALVWRIKFPLVITIHWTIIALCWKPPPARLQQNQIHYWICKTNTKVKLDSQIGGLRNLEASENPDLCIKSYLGKRFNGQNYRSLWWNRTCLLATFCLLGTFFKIYLGEIWH